MKTNILKVTASFSLSVTVLLACATPPAEPQATVAAPVASKTAGPVSCEMVGLKIQASNGDPEATKGCIEHNGIDELFVDTLLGR